MTPPSHPIKNPLHPNYGQPCTRHVRDVYGNLGKCAKCGAKMRPMAMRGKARRR